MVAVIGNGSLIKAASLNRTCPNAKILAPCIVRGWRRHLQLRASTRPDAETGLYPNVINTERSSADDWFNGVLIDVPEDEYAAMCKREHLYEPTLESCEHYQTGKPLGEGYIWVSSLPKSEVPWDIAAQRDYIKICTDGSKAISDQYLADFLATTFVDDIPLAEHKSYLALGL